MAEGPKIEKGACVYSAQMLAVPSDLALWGSWEGSQDATQLDFSWDRSPKIKEQRIFSARHSDRFLMTCD